MFGSKSEKIESLQYKLDKLIKELHEIKLEHAKCEPKRDWGTTMVISRNLPNLVVQDCGRWIYGEQFITIPKRDGGSIHVDRIGIISIERTPDA